MRKGRKELEKHPILPPLLPSLYYTSRPNLTNTRYLSWEKAGVPAQIAGKLTKPENSVV